MSVQMKENFLYYYLSYSKNNVLKIHIFINNFKVKWADKRSLLIKFKIPYDNDDLLKYIENDNKKTMIPIEDLYIEVLDKMIVKMGKKKISFKDYKGVQYNYNSINRIFFPYVNDRMNK
jgi:hypothetical protein